MKWPLLWLAFATATLSAAPAAPPSPMPTDAECQSLGPVLTPLAFKPGETLDFDVDAMGARAGTMVMRVLPRTDGTWGLEATVETNTFFSKIRSVQGTATSFVSPKTLRPSRYLEDATENGLHRIADVRFSTPHLAHLTSTTDHASAVLDLRYGNDVTDVAGAVFLLRSVPLQEGKRLCFDAYGIRRVWRVWGTVQPREHVSLPMGEFQAWHLAGQAARLDLPDARREVHVWVSDDAKRLPLAAMGVIDLGAVRATLKAAARPGEKAVRADNKLDLTW